jgi:alpha-glucosidase
VPIPWESNTPGYGFNTTGESWLPQPEYWNDYARADQVGVEGSTLELYRTALALRAEHGLGLGSVQWLPGFAEAVVALTNGAITVIANTGAIEVDLPLGEVLLASGPVGEGILPADTTVWLKA